MTKAEDPERGLCIALDTAIADSLPRGNAGAIVSAAGARERSASDCLCPCSPTMLLAKGCKRLLRLQPKPKKSTTVKGGQHPVRSGVDHGQGQQPQGDSGPANVHVPVPATQQLVCHPARSFLSGAHDFHITKFDFVDSSKTIQGNGYVDASQHITVNKYSGGGESSGV